MTFLKRAYKFLTAEHTLILLAIIVVAVFLTQYSSLKSSIMGGMTNKHTDDSHDNEKMMDSVNKDNVVKPAMASGLNSGPTSVDALDSKESSCLNKAVANPEDLLPKNGGSGWNELSPSGAGDLSQVNLLKAGHHAGIDTVQSSMRNSNLQIRSEPANPREAVSPWMQSTITPDLMRQPLEIGCGPRVCDN